MARYKGPGQAAAGQPNFRADVTPAIELRSVLESRQPVNPAFSVSQAPTSVVSLEAPAVSLEPRNSGVVTPDQTPGLALSQLTTGTLNKPAQTPAAKITQVKFDLTHTIGAAIATETVGGPSHNRLDWATPTNAQGLHDGVYATFAGNIAALRAGRIDLAYGNHVNKSSLVISAVTLNFYISVAGTLLNNADVRLQFTKDTTNIGEDGTNIRTLETITGDVSNLTTPRAFSVLDDSLGGSQAEGVANWTDYDNLRAYVRCESAIGETWTVNLDSIEVVVLASVTDTL